MMQTFTLRWRQCSRRERGLLLLGAAVLLILVFYHGLLAPLNDWRQQQWHHQLRAHQDLQWIQLQQPRLQALQRQQPQQGDETRPALIQRSATEMQIALVQDEADLLTLPPQPFPPLLAWLTQLELNHAVQVSQLTLQAEPGGQLSGTLRFQGDE
ncbi:type II secretion system protein GspM [Serratia odorifera]|uniref:type II secretion system protein GspM n=1 Tax=Serratia odorifera TaxID=618 RepID=UPI0018E85DD4|nr:type II secretion system protein GspM [Serratia odorifera]MBJ2066875.1 type II secretion system protein M [Serratia odorifera]